MIVFQPMRQEPPSGSDFRLTQAFFAAILVFRLLCFCAKQRVIPDAEGIPPVHPAEAAKLPPMAVKRQWFER